LKHFISFRKAVNTVFDQDMPPSAASRIVSGVVVFMIVASIASVVLDSVEGFRIAHGALLLAIERAATAVFAVEYVMRVWSAVDRTDRRYRHPIRGRLRYMIRPVSIIDLLAVLPAFLGDYDLRVLRLLRLLRMLKLTRHSAAFAMLWAVLRKEAGTIGAVLSVMAMFTIASGSIMYMLENEAQPKVFSSIPAAMWWSIITITTVGYGDMVPQTVAGKIVGAAVAVFGIGTVALFSGVLTASFMEQLRLRREQARRAIAAGLHSGRLTARQIEEIDNIGQQLGLEEVEVAELIENMISRRIRPTECPHCGGDLRPTHRQPARHSRTAPTS
jgi:voltage-gated potassium channel